MAVIQMEKTSKLLLQVETGTTSAGNAKYAQRTISNINPALSDDDAFTIGDGLSELQIYPLSAIKRQNTYSLASE